MSKHTAIGTRMKENYENRSKAFLTRRTPVVMRLDGKAFHSFCKGLDKPYDKGLGVDMQATMKFLCMNIQGAKLGYCQSDEISILITDYDQLDTQAWFDYNVQKMTSISASTATAKFNQLRLLRSFVVQEIGDHPDKLITSDEYLHQNDVYSQKLAYFDSRVFNIPKEEVCNYFIYRQQDAVRNSISMLAQSLYSHRELEGKNVSEMQEMSFQKGKNWNDVADYNKRGGICLKVERENGHSEWVNYAAPLKFDQTWFDVNNLI